MKAIRQLYSLVGW